MFITHLPKKYTPIILVALALLALIVTAIVAGLDSKMDFLWGNNHVASSTPETIDTSDWKTYRNEEYGFEFKYPEGWNIYSQTFKNGVHSIGFSYNEFDYKEPLTNQVILISVFEHPNKGTVHQISTGDEVVKNFSFLGREAIWYQYADSNIGTEKIQGLDIDLGGGKFIGIHGLMANFNKIVSTLIFLNTVK